LAQTIRSGRSVRVVDAKTHEDLTQQTLTQVIMESGRAGRLLPIPLLHQLIRMDDDALAEFFGRYVSWALEMYMNAKSGAQALTPLNPFATLPFAATNAFARFFAPAHEPVPAPPQEDSLADLRREIEELKQAMGKK
jgi:polyhydroxyalkanoate synthesis repressor PhaR